MRGKRRTGANKRQISRSIKNEKDSERTATLPREQHCKRPKAGYVKLGKDGHSQHSSEGKQEGYDQKFQNRDRTCREENMLDSF